MAGQIRITPAELRDGANTLGQQLSEAMGVLGNMKATVDGVCANWEGAAQNSFVETFEQLYKQISEALPSTVEGIQSMMNGAADGLEEADSQISAALRK